MRMGAPLKVDERERVNSIAEWVGMNEANWAARLIKKKFNFFLYAAVIGYMLWAHPFPYSFHLFAFTLIYSFLFINELCYVWLINERNKSLSLWIKGWSEIKGEWVVVDWSQNL